MISQTGVKKVPSWGIWRHRKQINVYMVNGGKRKFKIGTIGTTADLSNNYGAWMARGNPSKREWNNSSTNFEANRLIIKKRKKDTERKSNLKTTNEGYTNK